MKLFNWGWLLGVAFEVDRVRPSLFENYFRRKRRKHFSDQNNRKQRWPTKKLPEYLCFI